MKEQRPYLYRSVLVLIFNLYFIGGITSQKLCILGGTTYSRVCNYNDDKGSEYFNEDNYIGSRGLWWYSFGLGYEIYKPKINHIFQLKYLKFTGIGTYNRWSRPQFGVTFPGLLNNVIPDYQEQGFKATSFVLTYHIQKTLFFEKLLYSIGFSYNYIINYKNYNYLSKGISFLEDPSTTSNFSDMKSHNSYLREEKYLNRHNLTIGTSLEFKATSLSSIILSYDWYLTAINRRVDEVMIRKYRPHIFSVMLKMYKSNRKKDKRK